MTMRFRFTADIWQGTAEATARRFSDQAARVQSLLERGTTLKVLRLGSDVGVAIGSMLLHHGRESAATLLDAARGGSLGGAMSSAAIAALLNLHRQARGEQNWRTTCKAAGRDAFSGAGSGLAATLAASTSKIALAGVAAPVVAKAAAPVVAAAVAGWLAQEAAERGLKLAGDWMLVPDHALPEQRPHSS
ncbi:MAG: hypothetical protein KBC46_07680 [Ferrovibrio sp.]|jgi:hypothetical protein|nr:hypothetical protein [Ferrovibrio sp.]